jgi:tubulin polyglutamylase TTLL9
MHAPRRSGFARFTNCRFSMRREDITNTFIHLTNVAIQKHAPTFDRDKGMKWPIRNLRLFLNTRHGEGALTLCALGLPAHAHLPATCA